MEHFIRQHIQFEISDDDFVENPYGYGFRKKKVDPEPLAKEDEFVPCTYTGKTSTSSTVTDPDPPTSDDDFVLCTFKACCKK